MRHTRGIAAFPRPTTGHDAPLTPSNDGVNPSRGRLADVMPNPIQTIARRVLSGRDSGARIAATDAAGSTVSQELVRQSVIGGLRNKLSGLGGTGDKGAASYFVPTVIRNRYLLETFYNESWVCAKLINIPVDDMFVRVRQWQGEDENTVKMMEDLEDSLGVADALASAMKSGRLYGTGLLVIVTNEAMMNTPLVIENIKPGDLKSLLYFDRFNASVQMWNQNPMSPMFGQPEIYKIQSRLLNEQWEIHPSRVLRFDGKKPINVDGWSGAYERTWGVSEIIAAMTEIQHDSTFVNAIAHLSQEASIPVVKIQRFKEALAGMQGPDTPSVSEMGALFNQHKSLFRTLFLDKNDEFERVAVSFAGMAEMMDRFPERVAAVAGIPKTRFLSSSPAGMNATGESDMKNYAVHVAAMRQRMLRVPLKKLDAIMAKHLGLPEPLMYEWPSLIDLSDEELANISKTKAETVGSLVDRRVIMENEARMMLSGDPLFGELEELPEDMFEPDEPEDEPDDEE